MSDLRRRQLERLAAQGDMEAGIALERMRLQAGELPTGTGVALLYPPNQWVQVSGDMTPEDHGGTIARLSEFGNVDVREIQPVRSYVGEGEALDVGYPFWSRATEIEVRYLTLANPVTRDLVRRAGWIDEGVFHGADLLNRASILYDIEEETPWPSEEGPAGWSPTVLPTRPELIRWWANPTPPILPEDRGWYARFSPARAPDPTEVQWLLTRDTWRGADEGYARLLIENDLEVQPTYPWDLEAIYAEFE